MPETFLEIVARVEASPELTARLRNHLVEKCGWKQDGAYNILDPIRRQWSVTDNLRRRRAAHVQPTDRAGLDPAR